MCLSNNAQGAHVVNTSQSQQGGSAPADANRRSPLNAPGLLGALVRMARAKQGLSNGGAGGSNQATLGPSPSYTGG